MKKNTLLDQIAAINVAAITDLPPDRKPEPGKTTVVGTLSPWLQQAFGFRQQALAALATAKEALATAITSTEAEKLTSQHAAAHEAGATKADCDAYEAGMLAIFRPLQAATTTAKCVFEEADKFMWSAIRLELGLTEHCTITLGADWTVLKKEKPQEEEGIESVLNSLLEGMFGGTGGIMEIVLPRPTRRRKGLFEAIFGGGD